MGNIAIGIGNYFLPGIDIGDIFTEHR